MFKFIKFYFHKVVKYWWAIFSFAPLLLPTILELDSYYFESKFSPYIKVIDDFFRPWRIWIIVVIFLLVHVVIIYRLWKEKEEKQSALEADNIPEEYATIIIKMDSLFPEKSIQIRQKFVHGCKCLDQTKLDINTAICVHFDAYKEIRTFLINFLTSGNVQVTTDLSEIRSTFESNCSQLEGHNDTIGKTNGLLVNEHDIRKLIGNINDNLNSLLAHL